jgi:transposase-like protein
MILKLLKCKKCNKFQGITKHGIIILSGGKKFQRYQCSHCGHNFKGEQLQNNHNL